MHFIMLKNPDQQNFFHFRCIAISEITSSVIEVRTLVIQYEILDPVSQSKISILMTSCVFKNTFIGMIGFYGCDYPENHYLYIQSKERLVNFNFGSLQSHSGPLCEGPVNFMNMASRQDHVVQSQFCFKISSPHLLFSEISFHLLIVPKIINVFNFVTNVQLVMIL